MGGQTFYQVGTGTIAKQAFKAAVDQALYDYGHAGYTGTLAEKSEFVMMGEAPNEEAAEEMADNFIHKCDKRIDDKWGPAGCISIADKPDTWLFFGWASC